MKKHLFFAATAALVLASCSSDSVDFTQADVLQAQDDNSVQFSTYMGKTGTTRAYTSGPIANEANATTGEKALSDAEFGVFAYQTTADYDNMTPTTSPSNIAPNFMYNQQVTWSDPNWIYTPVKYWPNGKDAANGGANPSNTATSNNNDRLSFFAYAPYKAMADFTTPGTGTPGAEFPSVLVAGSNFKTASGTNGIIAMTTNEFTGNVWVKYLMPNANQNEAVDLLWGTNGKTSYSETDNVNPTLSAIGNDYNMNLTKQIVGEKVKFLFKHALAKIGGNTETTELVTDPASNTCGYMIKLDVDGNNDDNQTSFLGSAFTNTKTLVTVEKVEIKDGKSANDALWGITGVTTSNLANSGWFNIEQGKWENVEVATAGATYSITAENAAANDANTTDENYSLNPNIKENPSGVSNVDGTAWQATNSTSNDYTGGATGVTVAAQPLFAKETVPGLMVIPGGTQTLYVRIKYYVRSLDANLSTNYTQVVQTITNKVDLSSLKSNKYYKIIMHLGLTSVKFEAVVSDWQTKSDSNIDENGHETGGTNVNEASVWLPSNVVKLAQTTAEQTKAAGSVNVPLTGLQGSTLTVVSKDGTVVSADPTGLAITAGTATVNIAYTANAGAARNGTVVLTDGYKTITITIPQASGL